MFESDDIDHVLSQLDLPGLLPNTKENSEQKSSSETNSIIKNSSPLASHNSIIQNITCNINLDISNKIIVSGDTENTLSDIPKENTFVSPKHVKRKIINSHFDHKVKRKFPGPAGILIGSLEENKEDNISQIELLSQDIEYSQNNLRRDLFESPLWQKLIDDLKLWKISNIDGIKGIKQQAVTGNLRRRKAQTVTGFVETVDRSATDPLVILRDSTGTIKCTLHRDAWSTFSPYIISEYCALILWKPTVLTTGSAFKKHYLNITLCNIYAIYSSAVLKEEDRILPEGYVRIYEEDFTVIKVENVPDNLGTNSTPYNDSLNEASELLSGLDDAFSDDLF